MQAVKSKLAALHAKHQESIRAAEEEEAKLNEIISKAEALEALVSCCYCCCCCCCCCYFCYCC